MREGVGVSAVREWIEAVLGGHVYRGDAREARCDCLACGKEGHLYVNTRTGLGYCFKCGYSCNLARLIRDLTGVSWQAAELSSKALRGADVNARRLRGLDVVRLPSGCVPVFSRGDREYVAGAAYLRDIRGISKRVAVAYNVMYVPSGVESKFGGHVVFPDYDPVTGALRYYTSRRCEFGGGAHAFGPKSYHVEGVSRERSLFGHWAMREMNHGVAPASFAFLVEGPMDMLALAGRSIALLGKFVSQQQAEALAFSFSVVVVALDEDAGKMRLDACHKLYDAGVERVYLSQGIAGDPATYAGEGPQRVAMRYIRAARLMCDAGALRAQLSGGA